MEKESLNRGARRKDPTERTQRRDGKEKTRVLEEQTKGSLTKPAEIHQKSFSGGGELERERGLPKKVGRNEKTGGKRTVAL